MRNTNLIVAMSEKCASLLNEHCDTEGGLPRPLRPKHLLWMCKQIQSHVDDWSDARVHRWFGFIQAAMLANRILDLNGLKSMFDAARSAHGELEDDPELIDHLNPETFFEFELGGQG